jgi:CRISPR system Cascade subunit CasA
MRPGWNLLISRLTPAMCSDGTRAIIGPWEMGGTENGRTPVAADFALEFLNDATIEMYAGLLQLVMPPKDQAAWLARWHSGIGPAELKAALAPFVPFFDIYGEQPAFQVVAAAADPRTKEWNVRRLLRDTRETLDPADGIGLGAAIVAAFGLQAHAHSGGRGYATSLSAGGPLRTVPQIGADLFRRAWALVLPTAEFEALGTPTADLATHLPWTAPPRASARQGDAPASTVYFALPRRLLLGPPVGEGVCPLGGGLGPIVATVLEGPDGTDYPSENWRHPLTPYRWDEKRGAPVPIRAANYPSGVRWNDRVGLLSPQMDGDRETLSPASILKVSSQRFHRVMGSGKVLRVAAYGQRFENANYIGPLRSVQPLRLLDEPMVKPHEIAMRCAAACASLIHGRLESALITAQLSDQQAANKKARSLLTPRASAQALTFWEATREAADAFDEGIAGILADRGNLDAPESGPDPAQAERLDLLRHLTAAAVGIFDDVLPMPSPGFFASYAVARHDLASAGRNSKVLASMGLPVPET